MFSPRLRARLGLMVCAMLFLGSIALLMRNAVFSSASIQSQSNVQTTQFAAIPTTSGVVLTNR